MSATGSLTGTVATDTFARFVEQLSEALDDHERTGDEWAERMHFSRFHFDHGVIVDPLP